MAGNTTNVSIRMDTELKAQACSARRASAERARTL